MYVLLFAYSCFLLCSLSRTFLSIYPLYFIFPLRTHSLSISEDWGCPSFLALSTSRKRSFSRPSASPSFSEISSWYFKGSSFFSFSASWWQETTGRLRNGRCIGWPLCLCSSCSYHSQQLFRPEDVLLHLVGILLHLGDQQGQATGLVPAGRGGKKNHRSDPLSITQVFSFVFLRSFLLEGQCSPAELFILSSVWDSQRKLSHSSLGLSRMAYYYGRLFTIIQMFFHIVLGYFSSKSLH